MNDLATQDRRQDVAVQDNRAADLIDVIARAVKDPDVDVGKMQALRQMMVEEEDRQAHRAFNRAFVRCKAEIKPVFAKERNQQTNSNYADAKALAALVDPIMDKHGFAITYGTEPSERDGHYRMTADLLHEDGHEKRYAADIPIDKAGIQGKVNKTDTHAFGSSMTYGKRYMKLLIWDIATTDDDGNGAGQQKKELISDKQARELFDLLAATNSKESDFCAYINAASVNDIHAENFDRVKKVLTDKKARMQGGADQ